MTVEIRILRGDDEATLDRVAPDVFDDPIDPQRAREFLNDPRHHLAVAIDDGMVIGFASAVHYVHPDKPQPELWINELGVSPTYRNRGIGKSLMRHLLQIAHDLGCAEVWVLTERENQPAMHLYQSFGGEEALPETVMFSFHL